MGRVTCSSRRNRRNGRPKRNALRATRGNALLRFIIPERSLRPFPGASGWRFRAGAEVKPARDWERVRPGHEAFRPFGKRLELELCLAYARTREGTFGETRSQAASLRAFIVFVLVFEKAPRAVFHVERFRPVRIASGIHHRLGPNLPVDGFRFRLGQGRFVVTFSSGEETPPHQRGRGGQGTGQPSSRERTSALLGDQGNGENPTRRDEGV